MRRRKKGFHLKFKSLASKCITKNQKAFQIVIVVTRYLVLKNKKKIEYEIFTCLALTFKNNFQNIKNKNNCLEDYFYFFKNIYKK